MISERSLQAVSPVLGMDPYYPAREEQPLWLPKRLRRHSPFKLITPADLKKIIYFKGRLHVTHPTSQIDTRWYGQTRFCPYHLDLDEPGRDGLTARDHIHLWLTGTLERVQGGRWVYQESDERRYTTMIEEWPAGIHSQERWDRFLRREV